MNKTIEIMDTMLERYFTMKQFDHNNLFMLIANVEELTEKIRPKSDKDAVWIGKDLVELRIEVSNMMGKISELAQNYEDLLESVSFALTFSQEENDHMLKAHEFKASKTLTKFGDSCKKLYMKCYKLSMTQPLGLLTDEEFDEMMEKRGYDVYLKEASDEEITKTLENDNHLDVVDKVDELEAEFKAKVEGINYAIQRVCWNLGPSLEEYYTGHPFFQRSVYATERMESIRKRTISDLRETYIEKLTTLVGEDNVDRYIERFND